ALAAGATVAIMAIFVVTGPGLALLDREALRLPGRSPLDQVRFGLVIADAIRTLPNVDLFRRGLDTYSQTGLISGENFGEWPGFVLSAVILASPLLLLAAGSMRREGGSDRKIDLLFACSACLVFGLLFAVRGGLGLLFNIHVTPMIRAQERVLPFL